MKEVKALLVRTTGAVEPLLIPAVDGHKVIHESVGGWFDVVRGDDFVAYVHDEGLLIPLEPNLTVSALFNQVIAGDVVIVGSLDAKGNYDGENYDAPERFFDLSFAKASRKIAGDEEAKQTWEELRVAIIDRGPIVTSW